MAGSRQKVLQFFMTAQEWENSVHDFLKDDAYTAIAYWVSPKSRLKILREPSKFNNPSPPNKLFLAKRLAALATEMIGEDLEQFRWWLQIDPPRTDGSTLFMTTLSVRKPGQGEDSHDHVEVFKLLKSSLESQFVSRSIGLNTKLGRSVAYPDLMLTKGAVEHWGAGGRLKQLGVQNVEFSPKP